MSLFTLPRKGQTGQNFKNWAVSSINSLIEYLNAGLYLKNGPGILIDRTKSGIIISLEKPAPTAPQQLGASGAVQDLSVSVTGNTAFIGLSGSTATAQLVGTGSVEISGNTNGQIEIGGSSIPLPSNPVPIGFNGSHVMTNNGWAYMACTIESLGNSASSAYAYLRVISNNVSTDYLVAVCGLWIVEGQSGGSIFIPVAAGSTVTSYFDFPDDGNYTAGSMVPNGIICYD